MNSHVQRGTLLEALEATLPILASWRCYKIGVSNLTICQTYAQLISNRILLHCFWIMIVKFAPWVPLKTHEKKNVCTLKFLQVTTRKR